MSVNWQETKAALTSLTDDEQKVLSMLEEGKNQAQIAHTLGQHRSMIWRKVQRIKAKLKR